MVRPFGQRSRRWSSVFAALAAAGVVAPVSAQSPCGDCGIPQFEMVRPGHPWRPPTQNSMPTNPQSPFESNPGASPAQPSQPSQPGTSMAPGGQSGNQPDGSGSSSGTAPGANSGAADNAMASAAGPGDFGSAPSSGTGGGDTFNANMFGDALGRRAVQVTRTRTFADSVRLAGSGSPVLLYTNPSNDRLTLSSGGLNGTLFGIAIGAPNFITKSLITPTANSPLAENSQVTSQLQRSSLVRPGEVVRFAGGVADAGVGRPFLPLNVAGAVGASDLGPQPQAYSIYQVYNFVTVAQIAAEGGVVGRQKMSEDANPMPRDRLIFDYDYFSGATLTPGGIDVHRFVVGFEKTAFDGRASLEVRVPFASTLDSTSTMGMQSRNTELGDIRITPRFLAYASETFNVGVGVGVFLPTAADTLVRSVDGTDLVRFRNNSLSFSPYVGVLFTPNDRLYGQGWVSFDLDTQGTSVSANTTGGGLLSIGQYRNGTQSNLDAQLGYWMINSRDNNLRFRALGPFVELHYGTDLSNPTTLQSGSFLIGGGRQADQLNLSAGLTAQLNNRLNVQLGATVPVINNNDARSFDWQVGVRVNYLFGAAEEAPDRTTYIVSR
jgi:hypothetical protein